MLSTSTFFATVPGDFSIKYTDTYWCIGNILKIAQIGILSSKRVRDIYRPSLPVQLRVTTPTLTPGRSSNYHKAVHSFSITFLRIPLQDNLNGHFASSKVLCYCVQPGTMSTKELVNALKDVAGRGTQKII